MSISVFQIGLLMAGIVFLIGGAALALFAARLAATGRIAQNEADIRLAASHELATEVKRLAEKVEQSLAARDTAIETAFLRHNDACMASAQSAMATRASGGRDDDDQQTKNQSVSMSDHGHDDDDDDDHHEKHHALNEQERPSFLARLFRRVP